VHGVSIGSSTLPSECWQFLHAERHRHAAA